MYAAEATAKVREPQPVVRLAKRGGGLWHHHGNCGRMTHMACTFLKKRPEY